MEFWYNSKTTFLAILLLPLSYIFKIIVSARKLLYKCKILKSYKAKVPVIIVGNITVGGTGKTPLVIWLAKFLRSQGLKPGIISRGYGGEKQNQPIEVNLNSSTKIVGDEAILLKERSSCPVVVCTDRVKALNKLLSISNVDIIISDDGLQHYKLQRDIEIAVVDAERQLGNKHFLPAGPLREAPSRLKSVDFVIQHGKASSGGLSMQLVANNIAAVQDAEINMPIKDFTNKIVHAVAGIGNPRRFFQDLRAKGFEVIEHIFPDHYAYCAKDFDFQDKFPILMTEKDAVKCKPFADKRFWYLPCDVSIDKVFHVALLAKLREITIAQSMPNQGEK